MREDAQMRNEPALRALGPRSHVAIALAFVAFLPSLADAGELRGKVSSPEEGAMEGVLVTARLDGSTISHTVATRADGGFSFPSDVLPEGKHVLSIRATGYDIDGAAPVVTIGDAAATAE